MGELQFYLDENLQVAIAEQLRLRGIKAYTVRDLGRLGDADNNHLKRATSMNCVLCTYDTDYVQLAAREAEHAGIIIGQPEKH
jgi:predicted nuclease of predicted toxin-antitoxin system